MSTHTGTPDDLGGAADTPPELRERLAALPAGTIDVVLDAADTVSTFYAFAIVTANQAKPATSRELTFKRSRPHTPTSIARRHGR